MQENISLERLFDAFSKNRVYIPTIWVVNKIDEEPDYKEQIDGEYVAISADKDKGLDDLKEEIWKELKFVTVYLVKPDEDTDKGSPIIMKEGDSLRDVIEKIGPDFAERKKIVKIWGSGSKFPGQEVSFDTKVLDGMRVRFI